MKASLGGLGVVVAFVAALFGALSISFGTIRQRPRIAELGWRYIPAFIGGIVVATAAMQWALVSHDFSLAYVANNNMRSTPLVYTIAGMWASLEGSILLWALTLAFYLGLMYRRFRNRRNDPLVAWAMTIVLIVCAFFCALMIGPANPFKTLLSVPLDGRGANPLLQNHPLMAFHPPMLYLGYVGFTIPFSFAGAALITGRVGEGWLLETRRWTLAAWGALTVGIILGSWWSYEVLGWGGFWGWDAVENASLLPWLTGTAFIHSVLVQERRGMLRVWNLSLVCATFSLTILGTFFTRSGVISSVHAFSNSGIGPWLLSLFAVIVAFTLIMIFWRGDALRSTAGIDSPFSREGAFLANNVLFAGFAFTVLLGTVYPLLVEAWNNNRVAIGAPYFNTMSTPIGLVLLFLMAMAPVLPWRKASTEVVTSRLILPLTFAVATIAVCVAFGLRGISTLLAFFLGAFAAGSAFRQLFVAMRGARARNVSPFNALVGRANGGMVVHLGVIIIAVAISAANSYRQSTELVLKPGETKTFAGHSVEFIKLRKVMGVPAGAPSDSPIALETYADVRIDGGRIDSPALKAYPARGMNNIGTPSVRTGLVRDLYVVLEKSPDTDNGPVTIAFYIQPLSIWLWIGGAIMAIGTMLSMVPGRRRKATDPASVTHGEWEPKRQDVPLINNVGTNSVGTNRLGTKSVGGAPDHEHVRESADPEPALINQRASLA
jgi:cytochrome c-type biogenesis protein CcmF